MVINPPLVAYQQLSVADRCRITNYFLCLTLMAIDFQFGSAFAETGRMQEPFNNGLKRLIHINIPRYWMINNQLFLHKLMVVDQYGSINNG